MSKYWTSDLHFGHKNILNYDGRPWSTVEEMEVALIKNINDTVKADDELYILGDITLHSKPAVIIDLMNRIHCKNKFLIKGNHDTIKSDAVNCFTWIKDYYRLKFQTDEKEMENLPESLKTIIRLNKYKIRFVMSHFPMCSWDGKERGDFHLFGHVHNNGHSCCQYPTKINVGIMCNNFFPFSVKDIFDVIGSRDRVKNLFTEQIWEGE